MAIVRNLFGADPLDFNEATAASRVGARIRRIRVAKGLSQAELGARVDLSADRIQKYENGARKPKRDMLEKIAAALGVSPLALVDPNTTSYIGAMYAMFELEHVFNMKIEEGPEGKASRMCLSVEFTEELYKYMEEWQKISAASQAELGSAASEEERNNILKAYLDWEWNFPKGIIDKTERGLQKARLKRKIEELQEAYEKLENEAVK